MTTIGQEAIQSFGDLSGKKSSQPIDGSSKSTPLFTGVRGRGILRTSPVSGSRKFALTTVLNCFWDIDANEL